MPHYDQYPYERPHMAIFARIAVRNFIAAMTPQADITTQSGRWTNSKNPGQRYMIIRVELQ